MTMKSTAFARLAAMTAAFAGSNLVRGAIGFTSAVAIGRGLGSTEFGRWTFCVACASTLTVVVDLGFGVLLTREAARVPRGLGGAVTAAIAARLGCLVPVGLAVLMAAPWLGSSTQSASGLRVSVLLAAAGAVYGCLAAVFRAWGKWLVWILGLECAGALVQLAGSIWIVAHRGDVLALLWLATAIQGAQVAVACVLWRHAGDRHDALALPTVASTTALLRRAIPFALSGVIANAQARLAPLALGLFSGTEHVALFGAADRFGTTVKMLPQSAFAGALPVLAQEAGRAQPEDVQARFERSVKWFAVISAAALAVCSAPLIRWSYGDSFIGAVPALVWIAIGLVPTLVNNGRKLCLYASGQERVATIWSAIALAIQGGACSVCIPRFGASGAAMAMALGEAVVWWPLRRTQLPVQPVELIGSPVGVMSQRPLAGG